MPVMTDRGGEHVGCVQPAAHARLDDGQINARLGRQKARRSGQLKERRVGQRSKPWPRRLAAPGVARLRGFRARFPSVNADAFGEPL